MADGLSAALTEASPMRSTQMAACGAKKDAADQHLKRVQLQAADLWKKVTDDGPCLLLSNGGRFGCPTPLSLISWLDGRDPALRLRILWAADGRPGPRGSRTHRAAEGDAGGGHRGEEQRHEGQGGEADAARGHQQSHRCSSPYTAKPSDLSLALGTNLAWEGVGLEFCWEANEWSAGTTGGADPSGEGREKGHQSAFSTAASSHIALALDPPEPGPGPA